MVVGIVDALCAGGCAGAIIVGNLATVGQLPTLPLIVRTAVNDDPASEMIDSIRIGLRAAPAAQGYLVCPCDAAGIIAADVQRMIAAFSASVDGIIIARHDGRRGHPVIIPATLADAVLSPECDSGLNHLARNRPNQVREVECESPGTIVNINTPDDYRRMK